MFKKIFTFPQFLMVLFEISWGITFNIIGTLSLAEIFLFIYTICFVFLDNKFFTIKTTRIIVLLYIFLLFAQILAEYMVHNSFGNAARGVAITIVSFCHLFFLFNQFRKSRLLIIGMLFGIVLRYILYPNEYISEITVEDIQDDFGLGVLMKYFVAPVLTNILLIWIIISNDKYVRLIIIISGMALMALGARSNGLILLLSGAIMLFGKQQIPLSKTLAKYTIIMLLGIYGLYSIYVSNVLNGNITAGNSEQILKLENPYNPLNLLMIGRTEVFVGSIAFMDSPLWGWGAWKSDAELGYKYNSLQATISDNSFNIGAISADIIPSHSVLIGYGTNNGIFAFLFIIFIWLFIIDKGVISLKSNDRYNCALLTFMLLFIWNSWFSPTTHFRQVLPLYMAFIIVCYLRYEKEIFHKKRRHKHKKYALYMKRNNMNLHK